VTVELNILAAGEDEWKLGLVDTNPEALDLVKNLVRRMIQSREARIEEPGGVVRTV
jgi:hypothetical protein